ncbi:hypothetical protein [Rhizobium sp.]|uniref:hypothetical protein n=1 Tax=Rhizobium sp. TaxID=391 RepID=UPI0028AF9973
MLGFTPQQVNVMSMWQFMAAVEGYVKANSGEDTKMSDREADDLFEWLKSKE